MTRHRPYPSDLTDARWELIGPTLTDWRAERRGKSLDIGRPPEHDLRSIMDAILYVDRTGIPWRYLPHDFPPWETVYGYFAAWQKEGIFDQLNGLLRRLVREAEGRDAEPSACVLDAQSVKFGWLMHHRRLARDYETHPHRSEAIIHVAMIDLISRRLTSESTANWRDT